jgi:hypothetical protein
VEFRRRGIRLRVDDDRLRGSVPKGTLTPEDRRALVAHKDEIVILLRREEAESLIADAIEIFGARIIAEFPPGACPTCHSRPDSRTRANAIFGVGLRCGRCGGDEWRPAPGRAGEVICRRCWSPDGTALRPFAAVVPPSPCPACSGPAWRVCGAWRCEQCEPPASTPRAHEPPPAEEEREAVRRLAAGAGFPRVSLCPAVAVLPGEFNWRRFVTTASDEQLVAARMELERMTARVSTETRAMPTMDARGTRGCRQQSGA